jgi:hypothetical protein
MHHDRIADANDILLESDEQYYGPHYEPITGLDFSDPYGGGTGAGVNSPIGRSEGSASFWADGHSRVRTDFREQRRNRKISANDSAGEDESYRRNHNTFKHRKPIAEAQAQQLPKVGSLHDAGRESPEWASYDPAGVRLSDWVHYDQPRPAYKGVKPQFKRPSFNNPPALDGGSKPGRKPKPEKGKGGNGRKFKTANTSINPDGGIPTSNRFSPLSSGEPGPSSGDGRACRRCGSQNHPTDKCKYTGICFKCRGVGHRDHQCHNFNNSKHKFGGERRGGGSGGVGVKELAAQVVEAEARAAGDRDAYKEKVGDLGEVIDDLKATASTDEERKDLIQDMVNSGVRVNKTKEQSPLGSVVEFAKSWATKKVQEGRVKLGEWLEVKPDDGMEESEYYEYKIEKEWLTAESLGIKVNSFVTPNGIVVPAYVIPRPEGGKWIDVDEYTPPGAKRQFFVEKRLRRKRSLCSKVAQMLRGTQIKDVADDVVLRVVDELENYSGDFKYTITEYIDGDEADVRADSMSLQELKHMDAQYAMVRVGIKTQDLPPLYKNEEMLVSLELMAQIMAADTICTEVTDPEMFSRFLHRARTCHTVNINKYLSLNGGIDVVGNTCRLAFALWSDRKSNTVQDFRLKGAATGSLLRTVIDLVK